MVRSCWGLGTELLVALLALGDLGRHVWPYGLTSVDNKLARGYLRCVLPTFVSICLSHWTHLFVNLRCLELKLGHITFASFFTPTPRNFDKIVHVQLLLILCLCLPKRVVRHSYDRFLGDLLACWLDFLRGIHHVKSKELRVASLILLALDRLTECWEIVLRPFVLARPSVIGLEHLAFADLRCSSNVAVLKEGASIMFILFPYWGIWQLDWVRYNALSVIPLFRWLLAQLRSLSGNITELGLVPELAIS